MKVCPNCKRTFTEDQLSYCTSCGTPLTASTNDSSSGQSNQQKPDEDLMKTMLSPSLGPQSFSSLNEPTPPSPFGSEPSFNDPEEAMKTMIAPPSLFSDFGSSTPSSPKPQSRPVYDEPKSSSSNKPFAEPPPKQSDAPFDAPYQPLFSGGGQPLAPSNVFGQPSQPQWGPPPPPGPAWGTGGNAVAMGAAGYQTAPQQTLAVISLILGLVSITIGICCSFGLLTGPAAIITGIIALVQIKNNSTLYTGKGLAIGGIIMGVLYFVIFILLLIFNVAVSFLPIILNGL